MAVDMKYMEQYKELAAAVVKRAVIDYEQALRRISRDPTDINAHKMRNDCERFFKNEIKIYSDIDGQAVMRVVKEKIRNGKEGKKQRVPLKI